MQITLDLCISRGALFSAGTQRPSTGNPRRARQDFRAFFARYFRCSPSLSHFFHVFQHKFHRLSVFLPGHPRKQGSRSLASIGNRRQKQTQLIHHTSPKKTPVHHASAADQQLFDMKKPVQLFHGHLAVQPVFSRHNIGHPCFPILSLKVLSFLYFPIQSQRLLAAAPEKEVVVNLSASLRVQIRAVHGNRAAHDGIFRGNTDSVAQF